MFGYYRNKFGSYVTVTKEGIDASGVVTLDAALTVGQRYTIRMNKLIADKSVNSILVAKLNTTATFEINLPDVVQLSNPPLSGNFRVKCVNLNDEVSFTNDIGVGSSAGTVKNRIMNDCHMMYDKIEVTDTWYSGYKANGMQFQIRFLGTNSNPG